MKLRLARKVCQQLINGDDPRGSTQERALSRLKVKPVFKLLARNRKMRECVDYYASQTDIDLSY